MFDIELKLFAHDFVSGKLPTKVGEVAEVENVMGMAILEVQVVELLGDCVLAKVL